MPLIDCSCRGISPDCPRCGGKGEYDPEKLEQDRSKMIRYVSRYKPKEVRRVEKKTKDKSVEYRSNEQFLNEISLSKKVTLIGRMVKKIDQISERQADMLIASKKSGGKISGKLQTKLNALEATKSTWKRKIRVVTDSIRNHKVKIKYNHFLSETRIDFFNLTKLSQLRKRIVQMDRVSRRERGKKKRQLQKQRRKSSKVTNTQPSSKKKRKQKRLVKKWSSSSGGSASQTIGDIIKFKEEQRKKKK